MKILRFSRTLTSNFHLTQHTLKLMYLQGQRERWPGEIQGEQRQSHPPTRAVAFSCEGSTHTSYDGPNSGAGTPTKCRASLTLECCTPLSQNPTSLPSPVTFKTCPKCRIWPNRLPNSESVHWPTYAHAGDEFQLLWTWRDRRLIFIGSDASSSSSAYGVCVSYRAKTIRTILQILQPFYFPFLETLDCQIFGDIGIPSEILRSDISQKVDWNLLFDLFIMKPIWISRARYIVFESFISPVAFVYYHTRYIDINQIVLNIFINQTKAANYQILMQDLKVTSRTADCESKYDKLNQL